MFGGCLVDQGGHAADAPPRTGAGGYACVEFAVLGQVFPIALALMVPPVSRLHVTDTRPQGQGVGVLPSHFDPLRHGAGSPYSSRDIFARCGRFASAGMSIVIRRRSAPVKNASLSVDLGCAVLMQVVMARAFPSARGSVCECTAPCRCSPCVVGPLRGAGAASRRIRCNAAHREISCEAILKLGLWRSVPQYLVKVPSQVSKNW